MRIDILTACPELLESPLNHSIVQRAKDKGLVEIYVHNLRDFTLDKHRKIDDYAFGFCWTTSVQAFPSITSLRSWDAPAAVSTAAVSPSSTAMPLCWKSV